MISRRKVNQLLSVSPFLATTEGRFSREGKGILCCAKSRILILQSIRHPYQRSLRERHIQQRRGGGEGESDSDLGQK